MKIAIIGTRGVPANYGGFETFAEEWGARLAARSHQVTVYGRRGFIDPQLGEYRGMQLVVLPALRSKHLETVSHRLPDHGHDQRYARLCHYRNHLAYFCGETPRFARQTQTLICTLSLSIEETA